MILYSFKNPLNDTAYLPIIVMNMTYIDAVFSVECITIAVLHSRH